MTRWSNPRPTPAVRRRRTRASHTSEPLEPRRLLATIVVTNSNDSGQGSLRSAMLAANTLPGGDTIVFADDVTLIQPQSSLPPVTDALTIDGLVDPDGGARTRPHVLLHGSGAPVSVGLALAAENCTVRGVAVGGWRVGMELTAKECTVAGNYIGIDLSGNPLPNSEAGIRAATGDSTIGGETPADRNVISGNQVGILLAPQAVRLMIRGNFIGTDPSGERDVGNGIGIKAERLAGASYVENVISGNRSHGIFIQNDDHLFTRNFMYSNRIGVTPGGKRVGNGGAGIRVHEAGTVIGMDVLQPNGGNIIADNGGGGIVATGGGEQHISRNSIFQNKGLGIDLAPGIEADGVTENDALDADDDGPSFLQNFPVLLTATRQGGAVVVTGELHSKPNEPYVLEFFGNDHADFDSVSAVTGQRHGEGREYAGTVTVTTDDAGVARFEVTVGTARPFISSTATHRNFRLTSEFSAAIPVQESKISLPAFTETALRAAVAEADTKPGHDVIHIARPDDGTPKNITIAGGPVTFGSPVTFFVETDSKGTPWVRFDLNGATSPGFVFNGAGSAVQSVWVSNCDGTAFEINAPSSSFMNSRADKVGIGFSVRAPLVNLDGGGVSGSTVGVEVIGEATTGSTIQGLNFGTDATGAPAPNTTEVNVNAAKETRIFRITSIRPAGRGIIVNNRADNTSIVGGSVSNSGESGVLVLNSSGFRATDFKVNNAGEHGIELGNTSAQVTDPVLWRVNILDSSQSGIQAAGTWRLIVRDSTLAGNSANLVMFGGNGPHDFSGNTVTGGTSNSGSVQISGVSGALTMTDNKFRAGSSDGIVFNSAGSSTLVITLEDNEVSGFGGAGLRGFLPTDGKLRILRNDFFGNRQGAFVDGGQVESTENVWGGARVAPNDPRPGVRIFDPFNRDADRDGNTDAILINGNGNAGAFFNGTDGKIRRDVFVGNGTALLDPAGGAGLELGRGARRFQIIDIFAGFNPTNGVVVNGTQTTGSGWRIVSNAGDGIHLTGPIDLTNFLAVDNFGWGVVVADVDGNGVIDMTDEVFIQNPRGPAPQGAGDGTPSVVSGNGKGGILIAGSRPAPFPFFGPPDRFETNNSTATATAINLDAGPRAENNLTLHTPGDADFYRVVAPVTGALTVTAAFRHGEGDVDMDLLDASGRVLAASRGIGDGERLSHAVTAGSTYYLRVYGYQGQTSPDYDLTFGATPGAAGTLGLSPAPAPAALKFAAAAAAPPTVIIRGIAIGTDATGTRAHPNLGPGIHARGASNVLIGGSAAGQGNLIAGNRGAGVIIEDETDPLAPAHALNNRVVGNYIGLNVRAQPLGNGGPGVRAKARDVVVGGVGAGEGNTIAYNAGGGVVVEAPALPPPLPPDRLEPNDSTATATDFGTPPAAGRTENDLSIHTRGDFDYFRFVPESTGDATVTVSFLNAQGDLDVSLLDATGTFIRGAATAANVETFTQRVVAGRTYFIRVYGAGFTGQTNPNYDLSLAITPVTVAGDRFEPNDTRPEAADLGVVGDRSEANLSIHASANDDFYRFVPAVSGNLTVRINFTHSAGDLDMTLLNSSGQQIGFSNGTAGTESITRAVTAGQTYYVRVYGYSGATNANYTLTVDAPEPAAIAGGAAAPPAGAVIRGNAIYGNGGPGIDLGGDGVTPNDAADADAGANGLLNFPEITSATIADGQIAIRGTYSGRAGETFTLDFYASPAADPSGFGEGRRHLGSADVTTDGTGAATFTATFAAPPPGDAWVTATATSLGVVTSEFSRAVQTGQPYGAVLARQIFYNRSAADGNDPAATAADDAAVATDKSALRPGERASFSNISTYSRGLNGVMIDFGGVPAPSALTIEDFELHVGDGATWVPAPPAALSVRPGAGVYGSDRVTLVFPDNAVRNTWLRVIVKPNARTGLWQPDGLLQPDVFYFGSLPGDTGEGGTPVVNAIDQARVRANIGTTNAAAKQRYDFNRDGVVNATDVLIARANAGRSLPLFTALPLPPAAPAAQAVGVAGSAQRNAAARRGVWDSLQPAAPTSSI